MSCQLANGNGGKTKKINNNNNKSISSVFVSLVSILWRLFYSFHRNPHQQFLHSFTTEKPIHSEMMISTLSTGSSTSSTCDSDTTFVRSSCLAQRWPPYQLERPPNESEGGFVFKVNKILRIEVEFKFGKTHIKCSSDIHWHVWPFDDDVLP